MKVLALGGCGEMGQHAVKAYNSFQAAEQIVIADLNAERAKEFAGQCGNNFGWTCVDVSDRGSLLAALEKADLVINTVGPYFRFGVPILKACIEQGKNYIDICDDWQPTLEMLALGEAARAAGVTAVIGMGVSPGVSNLLGVMAAQELDEVHELITAWDLDSAQPEKVGPRASAATVHGIYQMSRPIKILDGGRYTDFEPLQKITVDYPGIGRGATYSIGHPEAVTLGLRFPSLKKSINVMMTSRLNIAGLRLFSWMIRHKIATVERCAHWAERIEGPTDPNRTPENMLRELASSKRAVLPPLFALAIGKKGGNPARVGAAMMSAPVGGMGPITGYPLAAGAYLMTAKGYGSPGVFAPESIFEPVDFFRTLGPLCTPRISDPGMLVLTSRSWEQARFVDQTAAVLQSLRALP